MNVPLLVFLVFGLPFAVCLLWLCDFDFSHLRFRPLVDDDEDEG